VIYTGYSVLYVTMATIHSVGGKKLNTFRIFVREKLLIKMPPGISECRQGVTLKWPFGKL
jgi:hypothetical protein